ncbi:probable 3-hydroxyisobutyryl-CoA hydrolase 3 isoform X1 [Cornus florida]|uniref:probable 3-hydroxyisobutyryl-CoA hydrolase 3 isoform X1 n=1 Tax=Cornus florida TaxID=4283 RepID=UPI0028A262DC|nr:probable 3-hydroxyisobutyryl-CoA hydrolase 3 isoform X1 [Cornus florida]
MASYNSFDDPNGDLNQVLFEANSCVLKVALNRPEKLNCLTYGMISQMEKTLKAYESDPSVRIVILKGKGKAFCAGGDVVRVIQFVKAGHWSFGASYYRKQLTLDYLLATYKKPLVSLINGIVMGGGAGLTMHGRIRIVTENAVFAMPEASIGLFPDVGASHFLSRLPGHFGEYLGLTGARLDGAEMLACGLVTHFVLSKDLQALEDALCDVVSSDTSTISEVINKFTHKAHIKPDSSYKRLEIINKCFSNKTVEEILLALEIEASIGAEKWVVNAIRYMKLASPTSLKVCLRSIRQGRTLKLESCLISDYIVASHMLGRTVNADFFEGSRAMLFDKDRNPKWQPPQLEQVSEEMVDQFFAKVDDDDWQTLKLPHGRSLTNMGKPKL